ncbi:MAG: 23S rRNA pseudouridine955/2504/2580 synthase [Candidatus Azotimanducaceae bacterium]|jgi:23S rRNA pseudouridine955/2504/2580 synthase
MTETKAAPRVQIVAVDENSVGQRVDNFLLKTMKGVPKSRIYRCVRKGEVRVNGKRVKADTRLILDDKVRIPPIRMSSDDTPVASQSIMQLLENAILIENEGLIILNKPAGIAVHGGSGISIGVIEGLRQLRPNDRFLELVHRLDRDTSGCLMVAKKASYLKQLQKLLQNKDKLEKHYLCLVHGRWPTRKQHVNLPLSKNVLASGERVSRVQTDGKASLTEFRVIKQSQQVSLLAARPVTGRTHQIRVHCTATGYPIVGDNKYGNDKADAELKLAARRLMLHASRLVVPAIDKWPAVTVEAPVDAAFEKALETIKLIEN